MIPALLLLLTVPRTDADTSVRLPPNGAVEIDTRTRDIVLRTTTGDVVTVRGGSLDLDGGTVEINGDDRQGQESSGGALQVSVPAFARVEVNSVGGSITITGTTAKLDAETVNGAVHLTGGAGTVQLGSVAGTITVSDFHGTSLSIDATADNVTVTNASGDIEVDNVNGAVSLRGIRSHSVTATSINEPVEFEGDFAPGGSYDFSSQNADVTLRVPANVNARLRISTMNGELDTKIPAVTTNIVGPATSTPKGRGKHRSDDDHDGEHSVVVVYGNGSASVTVDVFNGNVIVRPTN